MENTGIYIDCGSIKLKVDKKLKLSFEADTFYDDDHKLQRFSAVHCTLPNILGGCTISAYAVPKKDDSWTHVIRTISRSLRDKGISAHIDSGVCGGEVVADYGKYTLHIIGYQGDRWIIRGVVFVPYEGPVDWLEICRDIVKHSVIERGDEAMPAYAYLPLVIPPRMAIGHDSMNKSLKDNNGDGKSAIGFMITDAYHRGIATHGGAISHLLVGYDELFSVRKVFS